MLRFAEEILLMALDEQSGRLHPLPERALEFALAGAALADLVQLGRLGADTATLEIKNRAPTGDPVLDVALAALGKDDPQPSIQKALARVALQAEPIKKLLFTELTSKGILKQRDENYLWVLHERRYPTVDDREEREVRARIREIVLTPGLAPDARDVVLIGLMDACDLDSFVFTPEELTRHAERIRAICQQNAIVHALARAIGEIQRALLDVIANSGV